MKYKIHVPTESYGFVEIEGEGTPEEMVKKYHEVKEAYQKPVKQTCVKCRGTIDANEMFKTK